MISQLEEDLITLQSLQSGKFVFNNLVGFEFIDGSNDTFENETIFTIVPEIDGTVLLQSHDQQFMVADENGLVVKNENTTENGTWTLECFKGLKYV